MALTLRPTKFLLDGAGRSDTAGGAIRFEVDGLPPDLFAQIVRAPNARWRTQWGKRGHRLVSLKLAPTPDDALKALGNFLREQGYIG